MTKGITGLIGLASSAIATPLFLDDPTPQNAVINIIVQIIIGISTLITMFRKNKNN